jgi:hypothetical protein
MSTRSVFRPVKYFCGLICAAGQDGEKALAALGEFLGEVDSRSAAIPFALTGYYREEMGEDLSRRFVSFRGLRPPQELPGVKVRCMEIEGRLAAGGQRTVNLDPGYLSEANVIIATAKNHYHRVPLDEGVYAHLEYVVKDGRLTFLPWTYPDFKTQAYMDFFTSLRELYKLERKGR